MGSEEKWTFQDRFNNKIRKAQQMKTPLMIIIGDKEVENNLLTIRLRSGKNLNDKNRIPNKFIQRKFKN